MCAGSEGGERGGGAGEKGGGLRRDEEECGIEKEESQRKDGGRIGGRRGNDGDKEGKRAGGLYTAK